MQINIFPDESIHSYLIRSMILQGKLQSPLDLTGVVSLLGVINAVPKLDFERGKIFLSHSCSFMEKLLRVHTPLRFLTPSMLAEVEDYVLFGVMPTPMIRSMFKERTQMRYCRKCFKDQISEHGVPWFRLDWLYSTTCKLHREELTHVFSLYSPCCSVRLNILDCLLSVISGQCQVCKQDYWENEKSLNIDPDYRQNYLLIRIE